jgi:hypothetical protein
MAPVVRALKTLQEQYDKLKLKEAKLEADLAIRDCPELEKPIAEVILAYVDARTAKEQYELVAPMGPKKSRLDAARSQVGIWERKLAEETGVDIEASHRRLFYETKLAASKAAIEDICDPKFDKMKAKYLVATQKLKDTYTRLLPIFEEVNFNWELLLPSIRVFLDAEGGA